MNYYELLNIPRDSGREAVKRAYFAAVRKHSPDADPEGFKAVRNAYETLYDEKKRAEYDAYFIAADDAHNNELLAARFLMRQNKFKQAAKELTEAVRLNPDSAGLKRLLAEALWSMKKSGTADNICKELLLKDPSDEETLLLRGKIAASRGHTTKAEEYFESALLLKPENPKGWLEYAEFAAEHRTWRLPTIIERAMQINQDMFKENYTIYLSPIIYDAPASTLFAMLLEDADEQLPENAFLLFSKFAEFFVEDANYDKSVYASALIASRFVWGRHEFTPLLLQLLPSLEGSRHREEGDDKIFKSIYAAVANTKLEADKRIHGVLAGLTAHLIEGGDNDDRLDMECYIILELDDVRPSIKVLRDEYPEYFKLHSAFYLDALNEKKARFLIDKYHPIAKRLLSKRRGAAAPEMLEYMPVQETYVRETPKTGRNEPCPCGSGKKYKKCCL